MTISVVVPCFATLKNNHHQLAQRAIHSALNQTYKDIEVILVDDGSPIVLQNIWGGNVRVVRHELNRGLSAALNTGIAASIGNRFIILASDDEITPNCIEELSKYDTDVVCSDFKGDVGGVIKCRPADVNTLVQKGNCHSYAALVCKDAWSKVGGFKSSMNPSWEDMEFWVNLAKHGATWSYVSQPLHLYHRNPRGRDVESQTKLRLLQGKLQGYHQDLFGKGKGLVTFIIPVFNQEHWLPEALESINNQIYPHVSAVVVDDGSPGDVIKAVEKSIKGDVHIVRQRNKHLSAARNTGIKYALEHFNSQYLVMLDADDTIDQLYVEDLMGDLSEDNQYIYADIKFIGDANHHYVLKDYDCRAIVKHHLHPCTFLAPSQLWQTIINKRGYAYDEQMKKGYEDWEFALAALQYGFCGKRFPKHYFHYRYHNDGSMRMEATEINDELAAYVKSKHPWILNQENVRMACSTCGGRTVSMRQVTNKNGGVALVINIPGVGQVDGREPLQVMYKGMAGTTFTKIGVGGTIYKYSGDPNGTYPNKFTIFAKDAHLFVGPFAIQRISVPQTTVAEVVPAQPVMAPVEIVKAVDPLLAKFEARESQLRVTSLEPDDFTKLAKVGSVGATQLNEAGFAYYADIADASVDEVALVLKIGKKAAQVIIDDAKSKL
jgi:glycosyltransferase involved in cell wall biosynthesis/predicted flap endonuclease-1-like 5' DNA nuclease